MKFSRQRFWPVQSSFTFNRPSPKIQVLIVRKKQDSSGEKEAEREYQIYDPKRDTHIFNDEIFLATCDSGYPEIDNAKEYSLLEQNFHHILAHTPPQIDRIREMFSKYGSLIFPIKREQISLPSPESGFLNDGQDRKLIFVYENIAVWIKLIAKLHVLIKARELYLSKSSTFDLSELFSNSQKSSTHRLGLSAIWNGKNWNYEYGYEMAISISRNMSYHAKNMSLDLPYCASIRNIWQKQKDLKRRQQRYALRQTIAKEINAIFDNTTDEIKQNDSVLPNSDIAKYYHPLATPRLVRNDATEGEYLLHLKPNSLRGAAYLFFLFEDSKSRKTCHHCGKVMSAGSRPDKKYCSESCRSMAYQNRKRRGK